MEILYNAEMAAMRSSINDGTVSAIAPYLELILLTDDVPEHFYHPLVLGQVSYMLDTVDGDPKFQGLAMAMPLSTELGELIHSRPPSFMYKKYLEIGRAAITMVINYDTKMAYVTDHDKLTLWFTYR